MRDNAGNGFTDSERLLSRLCNHSFLTLWSYSNLFNDKCGVVKGGDGQELCDLVVIFDNSIILFSDKDCQFRDSGNLDVDWSRWYRNAIKKSADQIFGAERWIREYPTRIFLDKKCQKPFPIALPNPNKLRVHRIVVAHGAANRCQQELGGSGSLMLHSGIIGDSHCVKESDGGKPFTIGQVNPTKGFVHLFDDATLPMVLQQLDTVSDFVYYLERKEALFTSGRAILAAGEENLLAQFLKRTNKDGEHDFILPDDTKGLLVEDGIWDSFQKNPQRLAQIEADKVSYFWDGLIEKFSFHALNGTSEWQSEPGLQPHEEALRFMAKECRLRRRYLSGAMLDFIRKTPPTHRATRIVKPYLPGQPYYNFLLMPQPEDMSYEQYREMRRLMLQNYCIILKHDFPDALQIIGIATEPGWPPERSEDLVCVDLSGWTEADQKDAKERKQLMIDNDLLVDRNSFFTNIVEYPKVPGAGSVSNLRKAGDMMNGNNRNKPCPCSSGKKFKKCCGYN